MNRYFSLLVLMLLTACASAPAAVPSSVPTTTKTPPTQPPTETSTLQAGPSLRAGQFSFAFYHPKRGQVLMVNGGPERGKPADDPLEVWGWDGHQWTLVAADENGPTWRNWPAIGYDSARDILVIHGGLQSPGRGFDETWEWDGSIWKKFTGSGPGAREGSLMVYDAGREKMVLFGGAQGLEIQGDTWEWANGTWTRVSETGPAPRFPGGMVYDPARQHVLLYSGHFAASTGEFVQYDDLWAWDGSAWNEIQVEGDSPGHRTHAALVFDTQTERVLLFSGGADTFRSDTWAWDGGRWTELPVSDTPVRSGHSVAYDPKRDRFIFFGGIEQPARPAMGDTWEWDRNTWTCIDQCQ